MKGEESNSYRSFLFKGVSAIYYSTLTHTLPGRDISSPYIYSLYSYLHTHMSCHYRILFSAESVSIVSSGTIFSSTRTGCCRRRKGNERTRRKIQDSILSCRLLVRMNYEVIFSTHQQQQSAMANVISVYFSPSENKI